MKVLFTIPLLLALLLIYHYDRTRSAASWSVLARQIHSSAWPSVLRADSVASQHVHWSITTVAYLNLGLAFLGVVSGVITPLGLGEEIKAATARNPRFEYAPDLSSFGNGTMGRPDMPMSRECPFHESQCPGAFVPGADFGLNNTNPKITGTTKIPQNITEMFRSATDGSTVASPLDIQYRFWMPFKSKYFDDNKPYAKGRFKHIDMLLSQEGYVLAEGVIVDTTNGGIGYRNHTVPIGLPYGGEWTEDILWIEPQVSCANTNLSLEIVLGEPVSDIAEWRSRYLIDGGGFANMPTVSPLDDWPNLTFSDPKVEERANRSAWLSNILTSIMLNITDMDEWKYGLNVSTGQKYNLSLPGSDLGNTPNLGVFNNQLDASWFADYMYGDFLPNNSLADSDGNVLSPEEDYPDVLAAALFKDVGGYCRGLFNKESANNDFNVDCGYLFGTGNRTDGGEPLMEEVDSRWEQPIYTCAAAVKASVKTVSFSMNGSVALQNLVVKKLHEPVYDINDRQPLWAVEDWWHPGSEGAVLAALWGIVDDAFDGTPGYNFTRSPHLYLPSTSPLSINILAPRDMLAAAAAPFAVLKEVMHGIDALGGGGSSRSFPAYSGGHSFALTNRWRALSGTSEGTETILRLVWTDIMASATVGTNLQTASTKTSLFSEDERMVEAYSRRITYDLRYAIPAILLLVMWVSLLLVGFIASVLSRHPFQKLKMLLNDTSMGRHAASAVDPASKDLMRAKTGRWLDRAGYIPLKLGHEPAHEYIQTYKGASESEQGEKNNRAPFVQPLMRNGSLEGVSRESSSGYRK